MEKNQKEQKFSPLINGLRGVAVLLVLGFHFNVPFLEQGFWGVDLFFWISGFLITGGFLREYDKNRESNQKFGWIDVRYYFLRRVKRILPLSLLVVFWVAIIVILSGHPEAVTQTLRRIPRILTFSFNMQLQNDAQDYFLGSSQDYGLLHYWSLSVEEQVYILSPFIFLLATSLHGRKVLGWRSNWTSRVLVLNGLLTVCSFAFMIIQNNVNSVSNYYSTFSRFWEFGLGAICGILNFQGLSRKLNNQLSIYLSQFSSVTLIASLVFLKNDIFGPVVLIPLLSTSIFVLINFSTRRRTFLTRLLETRVLQFLGTIAFPLYLVHWPAMVVLHQSKFHSSLLNVLLYLLFIVAISYILHRYVGLPAIKINLEKFRISPDSNKIKYLSGRVRSRKRVAIVFLTVIITPMVWLSYPTEVGKSFNNVSSFFLQNRYGTLTATDVEEEGVKPTEPSPRNTSVTSNDPAKIQPTQSPKPQMTNNLVKPTTSELGGNGTEKILLSWKSDLIKASQMFELPNGYQVDQAEVMKELRRGWNGGCLDSKSYESACTYGTGSRTAVLLGDSFSFALLDGLKKSLPGNWSLRVLTKGSCLPWEIIQFNSSGELNKECNEHNLWVNEQLSAVKPDLIIATGADQWLQRSNLKKWSDGFSNSLKFYSENSGKVVIFTSAPGSGNLSNCIANGRSLRACFGTASQISKFVAFQSSETRKYKSEFVNLIDYLCVNGSCPPIIQDVPVYAEGNHLSNIFSSKFSTVIKNLHLFS